ncbi:divergent polysaccharide deacetylase family protein [Evansella sp. AB-P1]|uniref:divergent polysaccharide deacetylase family protein n=1 Tax=Evansella sp. AB-P1 TaxID=3037653 RepID=UPI00241E7A64|nr:divergent polysaccharide deacetylase family protein [Evansella sp. AB-P1]MDG5787715.1 divergent polysaccharide deacetylase family protein [Evansella sp. AB-P1]
MFVLFKKLPIVNTITRNRCFHPSINILLIALLFFYLLIVYCIPSITFAEEIEKEGKAAIIIDDFGGNTGGVKKFFEADIPITVAIMPFLDGSTEQANLANTLGLEVMIHLPLEPKKGKKSWLGPLPITSDLDTQEVKRRVRKAIEDVPNAKGLNNHMGSKIVGNERIVRAILEVAKEHNLYVIDSGTSGDSVLPTIAKELDIPFAVRDSFLDDSFSSRDHVYKQMLHLCNIAKSRGSAIAIGHVGVKGIDTFHGINDALPHFEEKNVSIVPVSHLLKTKIEKKPGSFWQEGVNEDTP